MPHTDKLPRLAVVASIIGDTGVYSRPAEGAEPTPTERALAQALHEEDQADDQPSGPSMAELLLLAGDVPAADQLSAGLSQAFLLPDDSRTALAREERRSAFADLCGRTVLPQLSSQARTKADARLAELARRRAGGG